MAHFCGLDISPIMLRSAMSKIAAAGLNGRIVLAQGDAANFDANELFCRTYFDRVFFSYALSMIPDWECPLAKGASLASPSGGRLLVVDFGGQEQLPSWFRRALRSWLRRFHVEPRDTLHETLNGLAGIPCTVRFRRLFRDCAVRADLVLTGEHPY
jgi:S-adenosylmethionine-diacylgycerolhomoserine-N-methlytransferase